MQEDIRPPPPFDADALLDAEVGFDLIGFMRDHPLVAALIFVAVLVLFVLVMRRGRRR